MRKLVEGDILTQPDQPNIKVVGRCGEVIFIHNLSSGFHITRWLGEKEIEAEGWKLEEPAWKPKHGSKCFLAEPSNRHFFIEIVYINTNLHDKHRLKNGLIKPTVEEAIAKAKEMLGL